MGDIMTVLEDLVEIDSLVLDLEGRDYVHSVNAYETLKRKCSQDWEAFKYLQERVHDVRISEQGRNKMREIIMIIRMKVEVNQMLGIW
jgi:ribosomal protein S19E (S16A)